VAPDAPSAHLDANSNSGSKNDNLTNDNTPTIAGTAEAGSTVKIYDAQNDVLASVTADNAGAWSHTFGALQDGTYSYTVTTTDAAGNESQGSPISLTVDTAAPETTIDPSSVPPTNTSSTSASFTFSSSEANASFECSLDGAPFASCTSPKPVPDQGSLADSSHTFKVRATDAAGNTEGTPPSHAWTVDTIAPTVVSVSPAIAATGVAPSSNVTATFSEAMNSSSISDQTFTLKKQGSLSNLGATVSYDPTTKKATLDPSTDLTPSTTYTATITTGVKDSAGNTLAQVRSWTFTTGIVRPTVVSYAPTGSPPPGLSTNVTATFSTAMDPNTITTNTFTLTRVGSSVPLAAHVTYDSASKTATLDPDVNLSDSTSYTAVTKSGSDGVKDLQGNSLAQDFSWGFMPCDGGVILSAQSIHTQGIVVCG
jgi:hypothetical protein